MTRDSICRRERRQGGFAVLAGVAIALVLGLLLFWVLRTYLFPTRFQPVSLSPPEQIVLDDKLRVIGIDPTQLDSKPPDVSAAPRPRLEPEPYREDPSRRQIGISERELNALLANQTNLAERLAIDLSDDLASAKLLIPVDPEFPIFGGRILRVNAGVQLQYLDGRPIVALRGISLMGVPLPNAWLGNLKNVDLVERFGGAPGFWRSFAAGIDHMEVREGQLKLRLRE